MTITGRAKGDGTTYYPRAHAFAVPPCERLALRLHGDSGLHVYAEVYDAAGRLRASMVRYKGGASPWFVLSPSMEGTSPNCLWGPLPAGEWHVRIAARPVEARVEKTYRVEALAGPANDTAGETLEPGARLFRDGEGDVRWRAGDLHSHTSMSDGEMSPREKMDHVDAAGLDFYAVTDHDVLPYSWVPSRALALPGVEITTPNGHFNVICPKAPPRFLPDEPGGGINSCEGMSRALAAAKSGGAFCVLNHPAFKPWHCRWRDLDMNCVDALEILCDPTHPGADAAAKRAMRVWDAMLMDGRGIWGVGGSDSHMRPDGRYEGAEGPSVSGDPANYVLADGTARGIVSALKSGLVAVSRAGRPDLTVEANGTRFLPGQSAPAGGKARLRLAMDYRGVLRIVKNGGVLSESPLDGDEFHTTIDSPEPYGYVRAEMLDAAGKLQAFTNPVFFGRRDPALRTWGEYERM